MNFLDRSANFRFRASVNAVQVSDETVLIGSNHRNFVELQLGDQRISVALNMLARGSSLGVILDELEQQSELTSEFLKIVETLLARGLLEVKIEEPLHPAMKRFDRQILYFSDVMNIGLDDAIGLQERICRFRVGVLGVGGVGSYVVRTLASMGFGEIAILDDDSVEESNISRQIFYDYRDIGKSKVDVVAEKVSHISPTTQVHCFKNRVNSIEDIECIASVSDLIICAIDTPKPRIFDIVARIPFRYNIPAVYGGSVSDNVSFGPTVIKGKSRCLKCVRGIDFSLNPKSSHSFVEHIRSSYTTTLIDPINSFAASLMSIETVKVATGCAAPMYDKSVFVNLSTYTFSPYESLAAGSQCDICTGKIS
jgi:molybdopterin-synthase adenylyltransferase